MATIFLVDSEKGGVGKSLFALCLAHYLESQGVDYTLVDADPKNPDVYAVYQGIKNINFNTSNEVSFLHSRKASRVDDIFEFATKQTVLVNLPGNVHEQVKYWIDSNDLLSPDLIQTTQVKICKWFLSNGSHNSIQLLEKSLEDYQGNLEHILVCNRGLNPDWSNVNLDKLKEKYQFNTIDFPGLRAIERDYLEQKKLTFDRAIDDRSIPQLSRQRIVKFINQTVAEIEKIERFVEYVANHKKKE
jgi:cellulose biosynthesis protein BcsQ